MSDQNITPLSYKDAGVDIDAGNTLVERIKDVAKDTRRPEVLSRLGGFGALFNLPSGYKEPVLASGTDGVGTKLKLAIDLDIHNTIGVDLVAMCVNDLLVCGAEPLFFLDYYATGKLNIDIAASVISGIGKGCKLAGCSLVGGETAEMPGTYEKGKFDIAGFAVGLVDEKKILAKKNIKKNDLVLAIPSSGVHSNGYSLVRHVLKNKKINLKNNSFLKKELLRPTKIYVQEVLNLIDNNLLNGCANITGGGLADNIKRVIPDRLVADIDLNKVKTKKIFKWLKQNNIDDKEMLKTFNCGVGFCLIVNPKNLNKITKFFTKEFKPYVIGKITTGKNKVKLNGKIDWS